jgi:hypothetical protein
MLQEVLEDLVAGKLSEDYSAIKHQARGPGKWTRGIPESRSKGMVQEINARHVRRDLGWAPVCCLVILEAS